MTLSARTYFRAALIRHDGEALIATLPYRSDLFQVVRTWELPESPPFAWRTYMFTRETDNGRIYHEKDLKLILAQEHAPDRLKPNPGTYYNPYPDDDDPGVA